MSSSLPDSEPTLFQTQCMEKAVNNYSSPLDTLSDPAVTFPDMRRGNPILGEVEGKQTVPKKKKKKLADER